MSEAYYPLKDIPLEQATHYLRVTSMKTPIQDFIEMISDSEEVMISFKNEGSHFRVKMTACKGNKDGHYVEELFTNPIEPEQFERFPKRHISALWGLLLRKKYNIQ